VASRWTQAATILPPTLEVCGRRLLPFCLRHRVALEAIDSPVLDLSRPFGGMDIIKAVRILSSHEINALGEPLTFREGYHLKSMQLSIKRLKEEASKILIYMSAQSLWPRFWEKENGSKETGIPWHLAVIASLVRNGHSTKDAWTMPEAEAIWLHIAHIKAAGAEVDVISDKEWDAMEAYKRELEEQKKQTTRN
jgi:hypothetical protein